MLLKHINNKGPIYKVTICKKSLQILAQEKISEIPKDWTTQDFYDLLDEGKRFFSQD